MILTVKPHVYMSKLDITAILADCISESHEFLLLVWVHGLNVVIAKLIAFIAKFSLIHRLGFFICFMI